MKQGRPKQDPFDRFFSKIEQGPNGCWEFSMRDNEGYGLFTLDGRQHRAHRLLMQWMKDFDPALVVCHTCDNPPCVNPDHLFLGTVADNNNDKSKKRRNNPRLTEDDILEIRSLQGFTQKEIGEMYGVSSVTINRILLKKYYKYIP